MQKDTASIPALCAGLYVSRAVVDAGLEMTDGKSDDKKYS